jgi:hypothetical protein
MLCRRSSARNTGTPAPAANRQTAGTQKGEDLKVTLFTVEDIEHSFVREFSTGGDTFGPSASREYRRERFRIAILKEGKDGRAFYDSGMTYAEAYRRCYGTALELRGIVRTPLGQPIHDALSELSDDDEE